MKRCQRYAVGLVAVVAMLTVSCGPSVSSIDSRDVRVQSGLPQAPKAIRDCLSQIASEPSPDIYWQWLANGRTGGANPAAGEVFFASILLAGGYYGTSPGTFTEAKASILQNGVPSGSSRALHNLIQALGQVHQATETDIADNCGLLLSRSILRTEPQLAGPMALLAQRSNGEIQFTRSPGDPKLVYALDGPVLRVVQGYLNNGLTPMPAFPEDLLQLVCARAGCA